MTDQRERIERFRRLHEGPRAFVIPNPWDAGSARLLARLGFEALATTSAGLAFSMGRRDYEVGRDLVIEHARRIVGATDLPVSADLENGFGGAPEEVAETIRQAIDTGLAGGSIEDASGDVASPIYDRSLAVERVHAAVETVRASGLPFVLTARAENFLHGRPDLDDTIERLRAYQEAGADVLYAPGLTRREQIASVLASVDRPVNVLMALAGVRLTVSELSALGVRRISVGSALARAAFGALLRAAREMSEQGSFGFADEAASYRELTELLAP